MRRGAGAALALLLAAPASAQPIHGTHVPRSYDEGLVPRFSFEVIEIDARHPRCGPPRRGERQGERLAPGRGRASRAGRGLSGLRRAPPGGRGRGPARRLPLRAGARARRGRRPGPGGPGRAGRPRRPRALARGGGRRGDPPGGEAATSTPEALLGHLARLLGEEGLEPASRAALLGWMGAADGGALDGVPAGWEGRALTVAADPATTLTLAALAPPGRPPLLLVVAVQGAPGDDAARCAIHAEVSRIAARNARLADEGFFD